MAVCVTEPQTSHWTSYVDINPQLKGQSLSPGNGSLPRAITRQLLCGGGDSGGGGWGLEVALLAASVDTPCA